MKTTATHAAARPFLNLTAADLMTVPVRTISQEMSLREAAHLFTQDQRRPVVDADGRCVGVLSSSDFVTLGGEGRQRLRRSALSPPGGR